MQQQIQNRALTIRNKSLTPLEQLLADKSDIEKKCSLQKKKLNENLAYIQDNASGLLISGVSALLFPSKSSDKENKRQAISESGENNRSLTKNIPFSASDYLNITKSLLPVAWEIIQPFVLTWGISKAKSLIFGLFSKKRRKTS
jgi:hypothetical protein